MPTNNVFRKLLKADSSAELPASEDAVEALFDLYRVRPEARPARGPKSSRPTTERLELAAAILWFIASLDYLVACSPWAGIQDCREQANYFRQRVAFYKHFDGRNGKRDWRADLLEVLHAWQMRFPDVVQKRSISIEGPVQKAPADAAGGATGDPIPAKWL